VAGERNIRHLQGDALAKHPDLVELETLCVHEIKRCAIRSPVLGDAVLCTKRGCRQDRQERCKAESNEGKSASISMGGSHCLITVSGSFSRCPVTTHTIFSSRSITPISRS